MKQPLYSRIRVDRAEAALLRDILQEALRDKIGFKIELRSVNEEDQEYAEHLARGVRADLRTINRLLKETGRALEDLQNEEAVPTPKP